MSEAAIRMVRTDWQGVVLTLMLPLLIAGSFVWLALHPPWDDSPDWALGMLALLPLEFVRIVVLWILRDAYECHTPAQAVRFFLISLAALAVIGVVIAVSNFGIRETFAAMADADTWRVLLPPLLLIATDGVIGLYFFRGDPHCQAARLDAQGDDAQDWLCLAIYALPFCVLLPCFVVFIRSEHGEWLPAWLPPGADGVRAICLLYVAVYFAGKGLLLAHAYGARFQCSGVRMLSGRWIQFVLVRDRQKRGENALAEARKVKRRLRALAGAPLSDEGD